jgi:hypothetical protein
MKGSGMATHFIGAGEGNQLFDVLPVEFEKTADAKAHARVIAAELGRNRDPWSIAGRYVRVSDEEGRELYRTPLVNQKRKVKADDFCKVRRMRKSAT